MIALLKRDWIFWLFWFVVGFGVGASVGCGHTTNAVNPIVDNLKDGEVLLGCVDLVKGGFSDVEKTYADMKNNGIMVTCELLNYDCPQDGMAVLVVNAYLDDGKKCETQIQFIPIVSVDGKPFIFADAMIVQTVNNKCKPRSL